tara:strand:- start:2933 stop:3160 length:228 start_codon:yes stop_codon:yes gene_type:complete
MNNVIKETVLGGWKGSAVFSALLFIIAIVEVFYGAPASFTGFFIAGCGFGGWSIQEWQHLNGKVIESAVVTKDIK